MKEGYIKIASIPKDEKIVSTTALGGFYYWNLNYPFRHYKPTRYLVATENAVYQIDSIYEKI